MIFLILSALISVFFSVGARATESVALTSGSQIDVASSSDGEITNFSLTVDGFDNITSLRVQISVNDGALFLSSTSGLTTLTGYTLASSSANAVDELGFTGAKADVQSALQNLRFRSDGSASTTSLDVSITEFDSSITNLFYNPDNDHYYRYIAATSQSFATRATSAPVYEGMNGYLATITSRTENDFINEKTNAQNIQIGGSDTATEGTWRWTGGPEAGTTFFQAGTCMRGLQTGVSQTIRNRSNQDGAGTEQTDCQISGTSVFNNWQSLTPNLTSPDEVWGRHQPDNGTCLNDPTTSGGNGGTWTPYSYCASANPGEDFLTFSIGGDNDLWNDLGDNHGAVTGHLYEYGGTCSDIYTLDSNITTYNSIAGCGTDTSLSSSADISIKYNQSITFSGASSAYSTETVNLTAATTTSGLSITYTSADTDICTVSSSAVVTLISRGTCSITASQAGDDSYNAATSVSQTFTSSFGPLILGLITDCSTISESTNAACPFTKTIIAGRTATINVFTDAILSASDRSRGGVGSFIASGISVRSGSGSVQRADSNRSLQFTAPNSSATSIVRFRVTNSNNDTADADATFNIVTDLTHVAPTVIPVDPRATFVDLPQVDVVGNSVSKAMVCFVQTDSSGNTLGTPNLNVQVRTAGNATLSTSAATTSEVSINGSIADVESASNSVRISNSTASTAVLNTNASKFIRVRTSGDDDVSSENCANGNEASRQQIIELRPVQLETTRRLDINVD